MGTTNIMPYANIKIAFINSTNKHVSWPRYGVITILSITDYLETNKHPGLLFFADFQKAFDSLSHTFIKLL